MSNRTQALSSPADVRAWAASNGHTVGKRGKFSKALITDFNKAHKSRPYRPGKFLPTTLVVAKAEGQRPIRTNVNVAQARATLAGAGVQVGKRGRLSPAQLSQAVLIARQAPVTPAPQA
jgi:hypothetical protein